MNSADPKSRAEALVLALTALLESMHTVPTPEEQMADMNAYDAAYDALLRSHGIDRKDVSTGGDIIHVEGSWYVQFSNSTWNAKFSPTGLMTVTPLLCELTTGSDGEQFIALDTATQDTDARFTYEVGQEPRP